MISRIFESIKLFLFIQCILVILNIAVTTYTSGVIRTLEKRFGLSSTEAGLLMSISDVTDIFFVSIFTHFARNSHKPRVVAVSILADGVGSLLFAAAYILFPYDAGISGDKPKELEKALLCQDKTNRV